MEERRKLEPFRLETFLLDDFCSLKNAQSGESKELPVDPHPSACLGGRGRSMPILFFSHSPHKIGREAAKAEAAAVNQQQFRMLGQDLCGILNFGEPTISFRFSFLDDSFYVLKVEQARPEGPRLGFPAPHYSP